jgi:hypothetical protein
MNEPEISILTPLASQDVKKHPTYEDAIAKGIDTTLNQFGGGSNKSAINRLKSLRGIYHMNISLTAVAYKYYIDNNDGEEVDYSLFREVDSDEMKKYINIAYRSNGGDVTRLNHDLYTKMAISLYRYVSYIEDSFLES